MKKLTECLLGRIKLIEPNFANKLEPHYNNKNAYITGVDFISKVNDHFIITSIDENHKTETKKVEQIDNFNFTNPDFFEKSVVIHTDIVTTNFRGTAISMSTLIMKHAGNGTQIYRTYRRNRSNVFLQKLSKTRKEVK